MQVKCVWEHNGEDTLLYCVDYPGAYTRGKRLSVAKEKMQDELASYTAWTSGIAPEHVVLEITQEKNSDLQIADADSDVLFEEEKRPLLREEYDVLKALALKSAGDFYELYLSVPNKNESCLTERTTFYGMVPRTARQMYEHTKNVNAYYFGEVGVEADNNGSILKCRERGFELLEQNPQFLSNPVFEGSYGEQWTVRKMLRRFLWHDRIHAKAMYRMAVKTFGISGAKNVFRFSI